MQDDTKGHVESMTTMRTPSGRMGVEPPTVIIGKSRKAKVMEVSGDYVIFEDETPKRKLGREFIESNGVVPGGTIVINADGPETYEAPE